MDRHSQLGERVFHPAAITLLHIRPELTVQSGPRLLHREGVYALLFDQCGQERAPLRM